MTEDGSVASLLLHVDPSIRPQDDLFGHVNGGWLSTVEMPPDLPTVGGFIDLALEAEAQVAELLRAADADAASGAAPAGSVRQKIGDLFASFLDEDRVAALGASPLADDLAAIDAVDDVGAFAALLGRFQRESVGGVAETYVNTDDRRSDRYVVNILQGGLGLPDEAYYREDAHAEIRQAYVAHVAAMLELVGHRPDAVADEAARVMALETRLAAGHWDRVRSRDVIDTYNLLTLADLQAAAPAFDWVAWVDALGGAPDALAEVVVRQPSYFGVLSDALTEVDLDDWKVWLTFHLVHSLAPYLSPPFVDENFAFYAKTLTGTEEMRDRWKRGVGLCNGALGEAVGEEYVAEHFPPESKARMEQLVANLVEAYRVSIGRLEWMGADTRERALAKLDQFHAKIGYPNRWRDYG